MSVRGERRRAGKREQVIDATTFVSRNFDDTFLKGLSFAWWR